MAKKTPPSANGAVPEFLRDVVAEREPASARAAAEQAVLALNSSMMTLYDETLEKYKRNMRDRAPIILALFTGQGGQMTLYRPGHPPDRGRLQFRDAADESHPARLGGSLQRGVQRRRTVTVLHDQRAARPGAADRPAGQQPP